MRGAISSVVPQVEGQGLQGYCAPFDPNFESLSAEGYFTITASAPGGIPDINSHTGINGVDLPIIFRPAPELFARRIYARFTLTNSCPIKMGVRIYRPNVALPDNYPYQNSVSFGAVPDYFDGLGTAYAIQVTYQFPVGGEANPVNIAPLLIEAPIHKIVYSLDAAGNLPGLQQTTILHYYFAIISSH